MSTEEFQQQGKRKVCLDLQLCYSGLRQEELEYIDYTRTRTITEPSASQFFESFAVEPEDGLSIDEEIEVEEDYETSENFPRDADDLQSYLRSTPTTRRKHRAYFSQDDDFQMFPQLESGRNHLSNTMDSGVQTKSLTGNQIVSYFGEGNDSIEDLPLAGSATGSPIRPLRRKIEISSEIHDPYSNIGDFDLSIEEIPQLHSTTTLGTLKRRLSLKYFKRSTSTGLFGSYVQQTPDIPPAQHMLQTNDRAPLINKSTGPINLWFRKFRNRHFI